MTIGLGRRRLAETLGSAILTGTMIGSGILAARLSGGNDAVALVGNTAATGAILFVLISALGPISGAHFKPAVTLVIALRREIPVAYALAYMPIQIAGCIAGAWLAHAMFALPLIQFSTRARAGGAQILSESVATFALVFTIQTVSRWKPSSIPAAVALGITAGCWWTASTSFANPAIAIARAMTDAFAGVRPIDAPGFIAGPFAGALAALSVCAILLPKLDKP